MKAEQIIEELLPHMLRALIHKGRITNEMLCDVRRLSSVFKKHVRTAAEQFSVVIALHEDFATEAFRLWDKGRKYPAIVLFATAVEQALNSHYRLVFLASGLTNDQVTKIIRTQTLESKLSWLMELVTKKSFRKPLATRLRHLSDLRNSIVHYKAVPGHPDRGDDSDDAIKRRLRQLGRISLRRDFALLNEFLDSVLIEHDPSFRVASVAARELINFWRQGSAI